MAEPPVIRRCPRSRPCGYRPIETKVPANSALSAGQFVIIAVVPVLLLAAWLISVFVADREPRHRGAAAATSQPQQPRAQEKEREQPERRAA
jgi:hypothetical protein